MTQKEDVKTDLTERLNTEIAEHQSSIMDAFGPSEATSKDIIIPRILLMNPTSDAVTAGNAAFGEFRDSLTNKKIGDFKTPFEILPFAMKKVFVEYDATDPDSKKFLRVVPITPKNESLPYEDEEVTPEGKRIPVSRDYTYNFYVLIPSEIANGGELPYILSFRRTAMKEGKKLATQMYVTNRASKLPPPGMIVTIQAKKVNGEKSTWAIPEVLLDAENTRKASMPERGTPVGSPMDTSEVGTALRWFNLLNSGAVKEDEDSLTEETKATPEAVPSEEPAGKGRF